MTLPRLTNLADVLRAKGLPVEELSNWKTTSRTDDKSTYLSGRPTHFMHHHTATSIAAHQPHSHCQREARQLQLAEPNEPTSNTALCPHGVWFVIAAGPTNTNGVGDDRWHPVGDSKFVPSNSMNSYAIANEMMNNGIGEAYSDVMIQNLVIGTAAICIAYGIGVFENRAHFEWAPDRKVDPAGPCKYTRTNDPYLRWDMEKFRTDIQIEINRQTLRPTTPVGDEEMVSCISDGGDYFLYNQFQRRPITYPGNDLALIAYLWDLEDQGVKFAGQDGTQPRGIPIPFNLKEWQATDFRAV